MRWTIGTVYITVLQWVYRQICLKAHLTLTSFNDLTGGRVDCYPLSVMAETERFGI